MDPMFSVTPAFLLLLTPLSVCILITIPIDYCFLPWTKSGMLNLLLAVWGFHLATKSSEWGITNGYWAGKYWNKPTSDSSPMPTPSAPGASTEANGWVEIASWTTRQFVSYRGYQYGWGIKPQHKVPTVLDLIQRLIVDNCVRAISIAFIMTARDKGSPNQVLATIGLPDFPLRSLLAEGLSTLSFGFLLICGVDALSCRYGLICHLVHWIGGFVQIPKLILALCDPNRFQHAFNSPHTSTSLSWFWGKAWHQFFRRDFLMCGGFPASALAKKLGGGLKVQRICGLFGSFFISGVMHEFVAHAIARKAHPFPHVYFKEFPAAFVYFLVQPIGIVLEPYIIPHIPRKLGGGWLWVLIFTLLTATPFSKQYAYNFRLVDDGYKPLDEWNVATVLLGSLQKR
ncbi:uncharacterized protein MELLADRAFT_116847 [Melampsora larici-populina 98AG31]|uniref:Wax synthase domain-containing protein n=1 Tax=Melampsora larici-populina (strain 98AG31 / pathotype 3-4-7) TaxID=747676 RepID=F4RQG0_MELLP|nr:uncharacterized protein MELLADRAFT_116847 [Melampsora larici-populina 98AG31]EGG05402.1 hypothetical protein MELLADRAFT_116847 [Melampsora larici-populina 98AG31]